MTAALTFAALACGGCHAGAAPSQDPTPPHGGGLGACRAPEWTGQIRTGLPAGATYAWGVAVGCDGRVHAVGSASSLSAQAPLPGFLDSYDVAGGLASTFREWDVIDAVAIDAAGRLVVAGLTGTGAVVQRLEPDLAVDWSYPVPEFLATTAHRPRAIDAAVDAASNVYVVYESALPGRGAELGISKLSSAGALVWSRHLGTEGDDVGGRLAVTPAGDVFVSGTTSGAFPGQVNAGGSDAFVARLGTGGATVWVRQLGTSRRDEGNAIAVDAAGRSALAGTTEGAIAPGALNVDGDAFVAVLDPDGDVEWTRQLGCAATATPPGAVDAGNAVAIDAAGAIWLGGSTAGTLPGATSLGGQDGFVARYDASGAFLWARQFGDVRPSTGDAITDLVVDAAGHAVAAGVIHPALNVFDGILVRVAPDGSY